MSFKRSRDAPPGGYESWKEFYKAKKEKQARKTELVVEQLRLEKEQQATEEHFAKEVSNEATVELSTLSIALPGSILDNAQSVELRTYLAGQIARAACVFKVDEIVVYDDVGVQDSTTAKIVSSVTDDGEVHSVRRCCGQLARILQYLECPQYLRKDFFPKSRDLEYAGLLNPLDAPHHMRQQDDCRFREGIVLKIPAKNGSYVNVGLLDKVKVDKILQPGLRVTVEMLPPPFPSSKRLFGRVVSPSVPHQVTGVYWGYTVRLAKSLSAILTECPYKEGYDVSIGTSERGDTVEAVSLPSYKHSLVVFGGLAGLEGALEADEVLTETNPAFLFDYYLNTCPNQGSRTIRTEEAILITLAELRTKLKPQACGILQNSSKNENIDVNDMEDVTEAVQDLDQEENDLKSHDETSAVKSKKKKKKYEHLENDGESEELTAVKSKKKKKFEKFNDNINTELDECPEVKSKEEKNYEEFESSLFSESDEFTGVKSKKKKKNHHKEIDSNTYPASDDPDVKSKKKHVYEVPENSMHSFSDELSGVKTEKKKNHQDLQNNKNSSQDTGSLSKQKKQNKRNARSDE